MTSTLSVLILVQAYNAEKFIIPLLQKLWDAYLPYSKAEFLIVDDASQDHTADLMSAFIQSLNPNRIRFIRHSDRYGPGGNQKIGFRYALDRRFDVVVPVMANPRYDTAASLRILERLGGSSQPDCVLGIQNRISRSFLSRLYGAVTRIHLKEWHAFYRAYRVQALMGIAFELNSAEDHFNIEILLQLFDAGRTIVEEPLDDRASHPLSDAAGLMRVMKAIKASLRYRLQDYQLFYDVRFHPEILLEAKHEAHSAKPVYEDKSDISSPHSFVCHHPTLIPERARVLDIGCSAGYVARHLTLQKQCRVTGVDVLDPTAVDQTLFDYHAIDLNVDFAKLEHLIMENEFDVVLMLDVLEHLSLPELFLLRLYRIPYRRRPVFVFSTPNVGFFVIRVMLSLGYFNYGQKGILDITHKRLFSWRTFKNLFDQTAFIVRERRGFPPPYRMMGFHPRAARILEKINAALIRLRPSLFAYQSMVVAMPFVRPEDVLAAAQNPPQDPRV